MWFKLLITWHLGLDLVQSQRGANISPLRFQTGRMSSSKLEKYKIEEISFPNGSSSACGAYCAHSKSCSRFLADEKQCHLLETWPFLEGNSGFNDTHIEIQELVTEEWSQVMIIGGAWAGGYSDNVEVLDMKTMKQCPDPPKLPHGQFRGAAFVLEGQINLALGDYPNFKPILGKLHLDMTSNEWKKTTLPIPELTYFPVAQIRESWVLIIGGQNSSGTYMVHGNGSVLPGPPLPFVLSGQCGLGVDEDHIFVVGGNQANNTFVLKWSEQVWVPQAPMSPSQHLASCETFLDKNNDLSILVGDADFEIFSWSTRSWRPGPKMMDNLHRGQFIRYDGIPYWFGGKKVSSMTKNNQIYAFDPHTETWNKIPLQMQIGRVFFGVVKIPPGIISC